MSIIKIRRGEIVDGSYVTAEGFNMFGNPEKYGRSSNADIVPVEDLTYITFKATTADSTVKISAKGIDIATERNIEYTLRGENWQPYTADQVINLPKGTRVQFRNSTAKWSNSTSAYISFAIEGAVEVGGPLNSLINNATALPNAAFCSLFSGCTRLIDASNLILCEATSTNCYTKMFEGCSSLRQAPELPATKLARNSYYSMFYNCESLTKAPTIAATELALNCCNSMFRGCTSLTSAPELLATTLVEGCYSGMFYGCINLRQAPELPATALANNCYYSMFYGCTSLTASPALPATTLADSCYAHMFRGCSNLVVAPALPATELTANCYNCMFQDCIALINVPELPATSLADSCYRQMFQGCISLSQSPVLPATTLADNCYRQMFQSCEALQQAPVLPATELTAYCYAHMFNLCKRLTATPELPATTLADSCYRAMFQDCSSLVQIPEFPATTLAVHCYYSMFNGCTSLATIPELPATELADYCYGYMFRYCAITEAPALPATKLTKSCYRYMFGNCTNLTASPELPAAELAPYCYTNMFEGCSSLSTITTEFTSWGDGLFTEDDGTPIDCFDGWVNEVATEGSFYHEGLPIEYGTNRIPEGWEVTDTSEIDLPEIVEDRSIPLTITALANNVTIRIKGATAPDVLKDYLYLYDIKYKINDATEWSTYTNKDQVIVLPKAGDKVQIHNNTDFWYLREYEGTNIFFSPSFYIDKKVAVNGNITSLVNYTRKNASFQSLFRYAPNLVYAPITIPYIRLNSDAFLWAFAGAKIKKSPILSLPLIAHNCYYHMFAGCSDLTEIECYLPEWSIDDRYSSTTEEWVNGVPSVEEGVFIKNRILETKRGNDYIPKLWQVVDKASPIPLTLLAEEAGSTVQLVTAGGDDFDIDTERCIQYKMIDEDDWHDYKAGQTITLIDADDYVQFRNTTEQWSESSTKYIQFKLTGSITAAGNCNSLINFSDSVPSYCFYSLFSECEALTQAPELPAIELSDYCYCNMFYGCSNLTKSYRLVAPKLASNCYNSMFSGCISLLKAPSIEATELADFCCSSMFKDCTSLSAALALPVTTLTQGCYAHMFSGCTGLTKAPVLPSTALTPYCYEGMFSGCTSLTTAPELPAIELADYCYEGMFSGCTSLIQAPELLATDLPDSCYSRMFNGCSSLAKIKVAFTTWGSATHEWVAGVPVGGMFTMPLDLSISFGADFIPEGWDIDIPEEMSKPLTFTATSADSSISILASDTINIDTDRKIKYRTSTDAEWQQFPAGRVVRLTNVGDYVQFKNETEEWSTSDSSFIRFTLGGTVDASGDVTSLINYKKDLPAYCFYRLFYALDGLGTAPKLPSTKLAEACYMYMFCSGKLRNAVELPARKLATSCYNSMFFGNYINIGGLNGITLPATELAPYCYYRMFKNSSFDYSGTYTLPATTLYEGCYKEMFALCSLTRTSFNLPATTLAKSCYEAMFSGCSHNGYFMQTLPATQLADSCYKEMFSTCKNLLSPAPTLPATTLKPSCYESMFAYCSSLITAPELPAESIHVNRCYNSMFAGCTKLSTVRVRFLEFPLYGDESDDELDDWLASVASKGTFYKPKSLNATNSSYIPDGWTVKDID